MSDQDRRRWLDDASPADAALSRLLDAGRAELPGPDQLRALAKRLGPPFDGPPGSGPGGGGSAPAPATPIAPLVGAAAILMLCGWWWLHTGGAEDARAAGAEAPRVGAVAPRGTSNRSVPPPSAPLAGQAAAEHTPAPGTNASMSTSTSTSTSTRTRAPTRTLSPTRTHPLAPPHSHPPARDAISELDLLEQAHRALGADPARALAATETHAQLFPTGQYAQEREVIAIEALLRLGRLEQARARGERFLAQHAGSSHARKVRSLIARSPIAAPAAPTADAGAPRP